MWERVVGQDRAVGLLRARRRAAGARLPAGGPAGFGDRGRRPLLRGRGRRARRRPARADLASAACIPTSSSSSPRATRSASSRPRRSSARRTAPDRGRAQGRRPVRSRAPQRAGANKLLKTIEEPPARSTIMLVTSSPDRAPRDRPVAVPAHRLRAAPRGGLRDALVRERADPERPTLAARLAGGRLDRGRAMLGVLGDVRRRVRRRGGAARRDRRVGDARRRPGDRGAAGRRRPARRAAARPRSTSSAPSSRPPGIPNGHEPRCSSGRPSATSASTGGARTDLLLEGITALESVYRDVLAGPGAPRLNTDQPVLELTPRSCVEAIDACRKAREAFEFNPNESLLLERLLLYLPAAKATLSPKRLAHPTRPSPRGRAHARRR